MPTDPRQPSTDASPPFREGTTGVGPNNQQPSPRRRGAPRGNLNALKSGRHSKQLKLLVEKLLGDPELRRVVLAFSRSDPFKHLWTRDAVNEFAINLRRKDSRRRDLQRRYEWLPYFDEGEAPF
jgi:hypothetical protein